MCARVIFCTTSTGIFVIRATSGAVSAGCVLVKVADSYVVRMNFSTICGFFFAQSGRAK